VMRSTLIRKLISKTRLDSGSIQRKSIILKSNRILNEMRCYKKSTLTFRLLAKEVTSLLQLIKSLFKTPSVPWLMNSTVQDAFSFPTETSMKENSAKVRWKVQEYSKATMEIYIKDFLEMDSKMAPTETSKGVMEYQNIRGTGVTRSGKEREPQLINKETNMKDSGLQTINKEKGNAFTLMGTDLREPGAMIYQQKGLYTSAMELTSVEIGEKIGFQEWVVCTLEMEISFRANGNS
jgi:hypothetical protein